MLGKPKPLAEHEAEGEIERVYHDLRQVLRISGVSLNFRTWAGFGELLPALWQAVRANAQTQAFESAANRLREEAVGAANRLPPVDALRPAALGESQRYQARAALALYHYMNPKLLLLTSAVHLSLNGERVGGQSGGDTALLPRGVPPRMYPMEMVDEKPDDPQLRALFEDIKATLSLSSVNSVYRTLALWPGYLAKAWQELKPNAASEAHRQAADGLREQARELALRLPYPVALTREQVKALGEDDERVAQSTGGFVQLLPPLIVNVALLARDAQLSQ